MVLTDVKGIYADYRDESTFLSTMTFEKAQELIIKGNIDGGMIPKVKACITALSGGAKKAQIIDGRAEHSILMEVFSDEGVGTEVVKTLNNIEIREQTDKYYLPVFGRYPLALTHGKGCMVYDADGEGYLDFLAGIAVNSLGYAHPALVKAISEQAGKIMHCSNVFYTDVQARAVKLISEATGFDRVFLVLTVCF